MSFIIFNKHSYSNPLAISLLLSPTRILFIWSVSILRHRSCPHQKYLLSMGTRWFSKILSCPCGVMFHMNSIRVGLNSKEIVNGLGYEYLLKMMNDISLGKGSKKKIFMENSITGGGQRRSFSISNFFLFFSLQMV